MRLANWTLAVGAALFISGIAFIVAAARHAPAALPAKSAKPPVAYGEWLM